MPLTFFEAKALVSPDKPVVPGSQAHKDIIAMMRQSGRVFADDYIPAPQPVKRMEDLAPVKQRSLPIPKAMSVSKRDWLSIEANRIAYQEHLDSRPVHFESPPSYLSWKDKTFTGEVKRGMSKKEFIALLK